MAAPQSTPLPAAPQRGEPESVFIPKSNAFVASLEPFRQELQSQADYIDDGVQAVVDATAQAVTDATQGAEAARDAAQLAEAGAQTAQGLAENARDAAQLAEMGAEDARDAAAGVSRTYQTASEGIAATGDTEYFTVPSADQAGFLDLYRNDAGTPQYVRTSASSAVADQAETARDAAQAAANFLGPWADQAGAATVPATVLHDGSYWQLLTDLADIATSEPSGTNPDWDNIGNTLSRAPAMLDGLRRSVEAASGGRMTVFYTAKGQPSYFVRQGKFLCEDIAPGGELGTGVHEAFIFNGVEDAEIWVGAYQAAIIDGEAVSQPGLAPRVTINYDNARAACQAAGAGFDMMTIWDWAAISLWCMANGFQPRGNTLHGQHHDNRWEVGTRQDNGIPGDSAGVGNTLTGSGPAQWRHDQTMAGIADMVGNVWEWLVGMRMVDGRVLYSPDNGIVDESLYTDSLFDMPSNRTWSTVDSTGAGDALKRALIVPKGVDDPQGYLYTNLTGERLPYRGGYRSGGSSAGLAALNLVLERTNARNSFGFRPRFRNS